MWTRFSEWLYRESLKFIWLKQSKCLFAILHSKNYSIVKKTESTCKNMKKSFDFSHCPVFFNKFFIRPYLNLCSISNAKQWWIQGNFLPKWKRMWKIAFFTEFLGCIWRSKSSSISKIVRPPPQGFWIHHWSQAKFYVNI